MHKDHQFTIKLHISAHLYETVSHLTPSNMQPDVKYKCSHNTELKQGETRLLSTMNGTFQSTSEISK